MAKAERDAYDLTETPERRDVLKLVLAGELETWAGDGIVKQTGMPLSRPLQKAFHDLNRAGLVIGGTYTGKGYAAAVDWGLRQPAHGKGS